MHISELPDDILSKILEISSETPQEKIDKYTSIPELINLKDYINNHIDNLTLKLGTKLFAGCVYHLRFKRCGSTVKDFDGLFLIQSINTQKSNWVEVCQVAPDTHERIFGKFKIIGCSMSFPIYRLYSYNLIHTPPPVDYTRNTLLLSEPHRVYPAFFSAYPHHYFQQGLKFIYDENIMEIKNKFCLVRVVKIFKKSVRIRIPDATNDITVPKKLLYNTINHAEFGVF